MTETSENQAAWLVNDVGPYRLNALLNGVVPGYSVPLSSNNLIVENIMMNDVRNDSNYQCVIIPTQGMVTLADTIDESDPTILYVAGEYWYRRSFKVFLSLRSYKYVSRYP